MASGLAILASLAVAAPAAANDFTASRLAVPLSAAEPGVLKGTSQGEGLVRNQVIKMAGLEIDCAAHAQAKTTGEGAVTWTTSKTLTVAVRFTKCLLKGGTANTRYGVPVKFNLVEGKSQPLKVVYHANGAIQTGLNEGGATEVGAGAIQWKISNKICTLNWENQILPKPAEKNLEGFVTPAQASFSTFTAPTKTNKYFPTGEQTGLVISNTFKGLHYEASEGQCLGEGFYEEEWSKGVGTAGSYTGALEVTMKNGDLGFELNGL